MRTAELLPMPARKACRVVSRFLRTRIPWLTQPPPPGFATFHPWRSIQPIRRNFGWDTGGLCVDRYYIEGFLQRHKDVIRGQVLEVAEDTCTRRFGGEQ